MSNLTQPATCSYNGVLLSNDASFETLEMSATPRYSACGRTVIYVEYGITVKTILTVSGIVPPLLDPTDPLQVLAHNIALNTYTTDATLANLRKRLTTPGAAFYYQNNGFGDIVVNVQVQHPASGPRDVVWGPKPQILNWKPLGAQQACEVVWKVLVAVPECDAAQFDGSNNTLEFVYKLSFSRDRGGYTTGRTYSGFLRVPQTRTTVNDRKIRYTADEALERIYPALVPGFRRTPGEATISEDKCRIDFTIRDEEVGPNYPPENCTDASASHTASTNGAFGGIWTSTLSASYEIARTVTRDAALTHFLTLLEQRTGAAAAVKFKPQVQLLGKQAQAQAKKLEGSQFVIITHLQVSEPEIHGRRGLAASATYTYLCGLDDIAKASGMWKPVPNNDWAKWAASMQKSGAWMPRGYAGLKADPDIIVDLCVPTPRLPPAPRGNIPPPAQPARGWRRGQRRPPDTASWLWYVCWLTLSEDDEVVALKPLPPQAGGEQLRLRAVEQLGFGGAPPAPAAGAGKGAGVPGAAGEVKGDFERRQKVVIQERAAPTRYVYFRGYAARAGHTIPRPRLESVGGVHPVPKNLDELGNGFSHGLIASWFGVPVYGAAWNLRYVLPAAPNGDVRNPPNPFEGA